MVNGLRQWFSHLITTGQLLVHTTTIYIYLIQRLIQLIKKLCLKDTVHLLLNQIGQQTANGLDLSVEHMNFFSLMHQVKLENQEALQQLLVLIGQTKLVPSVGQFKEYSQKVPMVLISIQFVCQKTRSLQLQEMIMDFYVYIEILACLVAKVECIEDIQNM